MSQGESSRAGLQTQAAWLQACLPFCPLRKGRTFVPVYTPALAVDHLLESFSAWQAMNAILLLHLFIFPLLPGILKSFVYSLSLYVFPFVGSLITFPRVFIPRHLPTPFLVLGLVYRKHSSLFPYMLQVFPTFCLAPFYIFSIVKF